MTPEEFKKKLCEKIGKHFANDFPCFCGDNPLSERNTMSKEDEEKAKFILSLFD